MSSFVGIYRYQDLNFYTGTEYQPDVLSVFVKSGKTVEVCHMQASTIWMSFVPILSSFTSIGTIVSAVKRFFEELAQMQFKANDPHLLECWNAIKNLMRALIAFVPVAGNITLILFEAVRTGIIVHSQIENALEQEDDVAGVALDGKILYTIPFEELDSLFSTPKTPEIKLMGFRELCFEYLKEKGQQGCTEKITELLPEIREAIQEKQLRRTKLQELINQRNVNQTPVNSVYAVD